MSASAQDRPSADGELWVCYLEKALAAHCGGWDKINGGQCTHGWALLTGCQDQYTIFADDDGKYRCAGTYNPNYQRWEALKNSPHDGFQGLWPMDWPCSQPRRPDKESFDQNADSILPCNFFTAVGIQNELRLTC